MTLIVAALTLGCCRADAGDQRHSTLITQSNNGAAQRFKSYTVRDLGQLGVPSVSKEQKETIAHVRGQLVRRYEHQVRFAFLTSGEFVVFASDAVVPATMTRDLAQCYANPPCAHYCPNFVAWYMDRTAIDTDDGTRCDDDSPIWKRGS